MFRLWMIFDEGVATKAQTVEMVHGGVSRSYLRDLAGVNQERDYGAFGRSPHVL